MTIQAYAWAMDQPVPGNAFRVLLALANHTDHTTGQVHFDATTISVEALIQAPSLPRYLSALERNGYLSKDELKSPEGDRRDYWLVLDRDSAQPWSWSAQDASSDDDGDAQDVEQTDSDVPRPKRSTTSATPKAFRRARQVEVRNELKAAEPVPPAGQFPVIEGSRNFFAWNDHYRRVGRIPPFVMAIVANGKPARGYYAPSMFPPAEQTQNLEEMA
jgi:hypothetical protein